MCLISKAFTSFKAFKCLLNPSTETKTGNAIFHLLFVIEKSRDLGEVDAAQTLLDKCSRIPIFYTGGIVGLTMVQKSKAKNNHAVLSPRGLPSECGAMFEEKLDAFLQVLDVISAIIINIPETGSKGKVPRSRGEIPFTDAWRNSLMLSSVIHLFDRSIANKYARVQKKIFRNNKRFGIFKYTSNSRNNIDQVESFGQKIFLIVAGKVAFGSRVVQNSGVCKKWGRKYSNNKVEPLVKGAQKTGFNSFYHDHNVLYLWKHHHHRLVNIIKSSLKHFRGQESVERISITNLDEDDKSNNDNVSDEERGPNASFSFDGDGITECVIHFPL
ncbi:hypothetical protein BDC45DRAFT_537180 [Circinella umbellata]|nr:hypothetical protein BDC45DRAFT_537180 [Circinella umbellata]